MRAFPRAARWYAAALRHVPPQRQEHANVLTFLLRLLVQNRQYDLLSDVLADEARIAATDPAVQDDLEAAAMLTALHTGHPVKVAHEPIHGGPLDLYAWWLGEHRTWTPLPPGRQPAAHHRLQELIEAGATFEIVLGPRYRIPASGPLALGHTNRQIAAILHLSVKTIETTLTRLFTRTGCRSRVELAAAGIDGRLKEPRP